MLQSIEGILQRLCNHAAKNFGSSAGLPTPQGFALAIRRGTGTHITAHRNIVHIAKLILVGITILRRMDEPRLLGEQRLQ